MADATDGKLIDYWEDIVIRLAAIVSSLMLLSNLQAADDENFPRLIPVLPSLLFTLFVYFSAPHFGLRSPRFVLRDHTPLCRSQLRHTR